jgi:hypothetical protein
MVEDMEEFKAMLLVITCKIKDCYKQYQATGI